MIRVHKPAAPAVLLGRGMAARQQHCDEYDSGSRTFDFDDDVYTHQTVKEALRSAQHRKCAFCESFFAHTGYGDVEHFRPKAGYKQREADELRQPGYFWLAYEWDNLFYSCQLCNQRFKRNLFPLKDGRKRCRSHRGDRGNEDPLLIDPGHVDPSTLIGFHEEYAYAVADCAEGRTTIEALGLNREELAEQRRKRLEDFRVLVTAIRLARKQTALGPSPRLADQLRVLEDLMAKRQEDAGEYAAMARAYFTAARIT